MRVVDLVPAYIDHLFMPLDEGLHFCFKVLSDETESFFIRHHFIVFEHAKQLQKSIFKLGPRFSIDDFAKVVENAMDCLDSKSFRNAHITLFVNDDK